MPRRTAPSEAMLRSARREARAAVLGVAPRIVRARDGGRRTAAERKGVGDFVTSVDRAAERTLRRRLCAALPAAGFLGEESPPAELDRELVWVVDPIDGTSNFAAGLPQFAVAVALLHRGAPVLATMWCEPEAVLYEAIHGRGAFRQGKPLRLGPGRFDDGAIVGAQWHRGQQDLEFLERLQRTGARIRTFGCTVTQLADVAAGRLDGNVQQQGRVWDIAAPGFLVEAAGGVVTDWAGRRVFPFVDLTVEHTPTVAAPRNVHRLILRTLG